eukprot:8983444-Pyramimonas_sp.AAC.1
MERNVGEEEIEPRAPRYFTTADACLCPAAYRIHYLGRLRARQETLKRIKSAAIDAASDQAVHA